MAIKLTDPMTGDAFKAEMEKALDRTTGGVIKGSIYKNSEKPSSEYITKQTIDDIIYCLNNSTITLKRDENGKLMQGEYKDPNYNSTDCVPWGKTSAKVEFKQGVEYTYKNIYNFDTSNPPLGYKSPNRIININFKCIFDAEIYYNGAIKNVFVRLDIKNQKGYTVKSKDFKLVASNSNNYVTTSCSFNIDDLNGQYTLEISVSNNIEIDNVSTYFTLQIDSITDTATLRDIIKY